MVLLFPNSRSQAGFTLNFLPAGTGTFTTSTTTFSNGDNGTDPNTNQSRWLWGGSSNLERPEIVTDASGNTYYHMIVGDLSSGFIQESYVQMGYSGYGNPSEVANAISASGGTGSYVPKTTGSGTATPSNTWIFGNGYDPLDMNKNAMAQSVTSGNGTANPRRVVMRQIVNDGQAMSEFLKDDFDSKPKITQMVIAPDIQVMFDIDMRGITYSDNTKTAPVVNTMQLFGAGAPHDSAVWDMALETQDKRIDGGRFTYTDGLGRGGSEGTYSYIQGGFDQTAQDWKSFINPFYRNANPWEFESSKLP